MLAIRPMTIEDMPAAHALLAQLGYVLDIDAIGTARGDGGPAGQG